jgi:hypothetical protein
MGKHERAKKQVKRLQLRREIIRVLGGDSLARVAGGYPCCDSGCDTGVSVKPTQTYDC